MAIILDPEENELRTLRQISGSFTAKRVLEVGCGDGRLTFRYACEARSVTAIDPDPNKIASARAALPYTIPTQQSNSCKRHVHFIAQDLQEFTANWRRERRKRYDRVVLSWSL